MPGWPVLVDGKASTLKPSPIIGEHTNKILQEWLGLSEEDVDELQSKGALNV